MFLMAYSLGPKINNIIRFKNYPLKNNILHKHGTLPPDMEASYRCNANGNCQIQEISSRKGKEMGTCVFSSVCNMCGNF
jgi:hypothetical protein